MNISMSWARRSGSAVIAAALLLTVSAAVPARASSTLSGTISNVSAGGFSLAGKTFSTSAQTKYTLGGKSAAGALNGYDATVTYVTSGSFSQIRNATLVAMSLKVVKGTPEAVPTTSARKKTATTSVGSGDKCYCNQKQVVCGSPCGDQ